MTDPNPDAWGPILVTAVRSILLDLTAGRTTRAAVALRAARASGAQPKTVVGLLSQLGHLGVVDRADPGQLRLTVLGRPWADTWLREHQP